MQEQVYENSYEHEFVYPQEEYRQVVVKWIYETEKSYTQSLQTMIKVSLESGNSPVNTVCLLSESYCTVYTQSEEPEPVFTLVSVLLAYMHTGVHGPTPEAPRGCGGEGQH